MNSLPHKTKSRCSISFSSQHSPSHKWTAHARRHTHDHKLITDFYFIKKNLDPQKKQKQKQAVRAVGFFQGREWCELRCREDPVVCRYLHHCWRTRREVNPFLFSVFPPSEKWNDMAGKKPKTFMTCSNKPVSTEIGHHYTRLKTQEKSDQVTL